MRRYYWGLTTLPAKRVAYAIDWSCAACGSDDVDAPEQPFPLFCDGGPSTADALRSWVCGACGAQIRGEDLHQRVTEYDPDDPPQAIQDLMNAAAERFNESLRRQARWTPTVRATPRLIDVAAQQIRHWDRTARRRRHGELSDLNRRFRTQLLTLVERLSETQRALVLAYEWPMPLWAYPLWRFPCGTGLAQCSDEALQALRARASVLPGRNVFATDWRDLVEAIEEELSSRRRDEENTTSAVLMGDHPSD